MTSNALDLTPPKRALADFRPTDRSLRIKTIPLQLPEIGKIKIGRKGAVRQSGQGNQFQPPQKLDHFLITTLERGDDGNYVVDAGAHRQLGEKPRDLPVRLVFDDPDLNFQSRLVCYRGKTLWCHGDGMEAQRLQKDGTWAAHDCSACPLADPVFQAAPENQQWPKCKMNGRLSVMLDTAQKVGGVHVLRTTSYNTIVGITSSLAFLTSVTGGPLAGLPLTMSLRPKTATDPSGRTQTIYVASLSYSGSMDTLQDVALNISLKRERNRQRIERVEQEARLMLSAPIGGDGDVLGGDDTADVVAEFYPEESVRQHADSPPPRRADYAVTDHRPPETGPATVDDAQDPGAQDPGADDVMDGDGDAADGMAYSLVTVDGEVVSWPRGQEGAYVTGLITELRAAAKRGRAALNGVWESNADGLGSAPPGVVKEVEAEHRRLHQVLEREEAKAKPAKDASKTAKPVGAPPPAPDDNDLF